MARERIRAGDATDEGGTATADPLTALLETDGGAMEHYLELRAALEGMAGRLAALRATEAERDILTDCMVRIDRAYAGADPQAEAEADIALHVAVYEASHNVVLLHIMRALPGALRRGVLHTHEKLHARVAYRDVLREQHRAIYDGIMARNPIAAGKAAEDHALYIRRVVSEVAAAEARLESVRRPEAF